MSGKKRALGRGLGALIAAAAPVEGEARVAGAAGPEVPRTLPIARLRPNRQQPRTQFDDAALDELAASIKSQGLVQPLVVTPDGASGDYLIVAGERRHRAARRAGLTEVPVVVREVADERALLELALVENLQREDLDPIEEAEAYRSLANSFGLDHDAIAERVGKSRPAIANALRLLRLPEEVRLLLHQRQLTAGQARPLLALEDDGARVALALRAVAERLSARELEQLVRQPQPKPVTARGAAPRQSADVHTQAAAERLTKRLQTKVEIDRRSRGGQIRVHFHSEEELMRLFDLLIGSDA